MAQLTQKQKLLIASVATGLVVMAFTGGYIVYQQIQTAKEEQLKSQLIQLSKEYEEEHAMLRKTVEQYQKVMERYQGFDL